MKKSTLLEHYHVEKNHSSLVTMTDFKDQKQLRKLSEEYQIYLEDLSINLLSHEVDYLLSEIDLSTYDKEAFWRLDSVMQILENRSSTAAAKLIRKIREEVYDRVRTMYQKE
jgi:hypothetical protein